MKTWIPFPRIEGRASRQAHADLPEGTFEREISKEGFFGPATQMYHAHPPTGWTDWEGPLRPRAFDLTKLAVRSSTPSTATEFLVNGSLRLRLWQAEERMDHLVRNGDGDELLFVHAGRGELFCDYGHLSFRDGDYVMLPRGTLWRIECAEPATMLLLEATNGSYRLPERGIVGQHAIFDPAVLDTPKIDEAFRDQQGESPWRVVIQRRGALSTVRFPFNPLDAVGWHGIARAGAPQLARHPADRQSPLPRSTIGACHVCRRPVRGLHLLSAADRVRPGRAQGALLPQQRRF